MVEALLGAGAAKDAATKSGSSPLYLAAQEGHVAVVQVLITSGAAREARFKTGTPPSQIPTPIKFLGFVPESFLNTRNCTGNCLQCLDGYRKSSRWAYRGGASAHNLRRQTRGPLQDRHSPLTNPNSD